MPSQDFVDGLNEGLMLGFEIVSRHNNSPFRHSANGYAAFEAEALSMRDAARSAGGRQS